ncbi:hypothetical protein L1887_48848 [Cichorium endivia]|nr:hypothetical protein L1887_48848 [Cichorium endivia]
MIDELVHHCINEIGLDGEAGTEINRLTSFICQFHADHTSRSQLPDQLVDASYLSFVFRQLIAHPDVSVGLFVAGVPQREGARTGITKRKASAPNTPTTKRESQHQPVAPEYDWVETLDPSLAEHHDLPQLQSAHGDRLRLVLQPAAIKRQLVGADDIFLPPSAYNVLQIICRSRQTPVLSTDIGSAIHTDQKTVYYICKRLTDPGLIVKIKARETGTTASYFIAARFQDSCDLLIQQRNAEITTDSHQSDIASEPMLPLLKDLASSSRLTTPQVDIPSNQPDVDADSDQEEAQPASGPIITVKDEESQAIQLADIQGQGNAQVHLQTLAPTFQHVDPEKARLWMSSRPELVRFRIYLLCNSTNSKITKRHGLVHRINIAYNLSLKRIFTNVLEHAIVDGFLEVVQLLIASTGRTSRGLRMTHKGLEEMQSMLQGDFDDPASLEEQQRARKLNAALQQDLDRFESRLPRELTLERWMYEEVARAGPSGRTAAQLMAKLNAAGHFSRVIEQIILRAEDADGEPSMNDLRIRTFHEHSLRIRSSKLFSNHAWVLQSANDGYLEQQDRDRLALAGGPSRFHQQSTAWDEPAQINQLVASFSQEIATPDKRLEPPRRGRPPKRRAEPDLNTPPKKRGRPRKNPVPVDSAEPSPLAADANNDAIASSRATPLPTAGIEQTPELSDTPMERATSTLEAVEHSVEPADEFRPEPAVPDSPAAGAAKRRERRLVQEQSARRPTSLLATAPVVRPSTMHIDEAAEARPADAAEAPQHEAERDSQMVAHEDHPNPTTSMSEGNLGNVADLLSNPTRPKIEAEWGSVATPASKSVFEAGSTPTTSDRKKRTNLTQLRSAHALVQCIREAGGAMDALLIPEQLSSFVERHGFTSEAQLVNLRDKKVRDKAIAAAVNNDLLRRTYVRIDRPSAPHPRRQIIYLPDLPQQTLHAYCDAVKTERQGWFDTKASITTLTNVIDSVEVGSMDALHVDKPWHQSEPMRLADLPADMAQLAPLRQPFRDVTSVHRQHLGFLSGEMLRLKAFHHACAHFLRLRASTSEVPGAVSGDGATLPLSFFWTDAPLDLYLGLVAVRQMSEPIEQMALDPNVRRLPMHALPEGLATALGLANGVPVDVKIALYSLASQLSKLGVLDIHPASHDAQEQLDTPSGDPVSFSVSVQPRARVARYNWLAEEAEKPLVEVLDVGLDADKINRFWARMQASCLSPNRSKALLAHDDAQEGSEGLTAGTAVHDLRPGDNVDPFKTLPEELMFALRANKSWRPFHQLRPSQIKFFRRIDVHDCASASQEHIDRLAYATLVPQSVVRAVLEHRARAAQEPEDPDVPPHQSRPRFTWPLRLSTVSLPTNVYRPIAAAASVKRKKTQAEREKQGRMTTLAKARQLRQRRDEQFQALLEQAFAEAPSAHALRPKIETALGVIRKKFVAGDVRFDADAAHKAIVRAIRSATGVRLMPAARAAPAARQRRRARQTSSDHEADAGEADNKATGGGVARRDRRGRRNVDQVNFWTPARKELLRDAAVILRVRDEVRGRSDWTALLQVIEPEERTKTRSVIMAQWRSQYQRMRTLYGEEAYLAALESRWVPVYLAARQEGTLQDADFPSATNFDLVAQIELLRSSIDKNEVQRSLTKPTARHALPAVLTEASDFTASWKEDLVEEPVERRFEAFFSTEVGVTSRRLEKLLGTALGSEQADSPTQRDASIEELMAECAVRIVVATSSAETDVDAASGSTEHVVDEAIKADFCSSVGDARIEAAISRMLDAKLLRAVSSDPALRRRPGTNFVLGDEMQKLVADGSARFNLGAGDLEASVTHRRWAWEELCAAEEGMYVQPVETDGEAAAMMVLMEMGAVEAHVETGAFEALRQNAAFNARVLNDEDLESLIHVRAGAGALRVLERAVLTLPPIPSDSVLDWLDSADLLTEWNAQCEGAPDVGACARTLLDAGPAGLALPHLAYSAVSRLVAGSRPLAFFSPLSAQPVLVASVYVHAYTLHAPSRTLPHAWTTLHPTPHPTSTRLWRSLLEHCLALVRQRPGISFSALARRFEPRTGAPAVSAADVWLAITALCDAQAVVAQTDLSLHVYPTRPLAAFAA